MDFSSWLVVSCVSAHTDKENSNLVERTNEQFSFFIFVWLLSNLFDTNRISWLFQGVGTVMVLYVLYLFAKLYHSHEFRMFVLNILIGIICFASYCLQSKSFNVFQFKNLLV